MDNSKAGIYTFGTFGLGTLCSLLRWSGYELVGSSLLLDPVFDYYMYLYVVCSKLFPLCTSI